MNINFSLDHQYKLYLNRIGFAGENVLPVDQNREMKRAFMGACGQMLILLRDDVGALEEMEAIGVMEDMVSQVGNFWLKEQQKQN